MSNNNQTANLAQTVATQFAPHYRHLSVFAVKRRSDNPIGYAAEHVKRVGDHYERRCPCCGKKGIVGIYAGREQASWNYIARKSWMCVTCEKDYREVMDARYSMQCAEVV